MNWIIYITPHILLIRNLVVIIIIAMINGLDYDMVIYGCIRLNGSFWGSRMQTRGTRALADTLHTAVITNHEEGQI